MKTENQKLELWIALHITKTLRRLTDAEYAAVVTECEEVNKEPHPNLMLTQPYRYEGMLPKYTSDIVTAMQVLEICRLHTEQLYHDEQYFSVRIDFDADESVIYLLNQKYMECSHQTYFGGITELPEAICQFAKKLLKNVRVAESADAPHKPCGTGDSQQSEASTK